MDQYEVLGYLGKGSFGSVSKIKRKSDGKILVWKEIFYGEMREQEKQLLVNEVNILQKLKHPNIVRCYDRIIDKQTTKIYIVMEYCTGGDLSQLIKKCTRDQIYIDEEVIWRTLVQILSALHDIHNRKDGVILHRDIKPCNLFLDENRNVKLGDFGLAKILTTSMHAHTFVGTPHYMSPEQVHGLPYNDKSDVWSVGCLIYEMCTFKQPFHDAKDHQQLNLKIQNGVYYPIPSHYSNDLSNVIAMMMSVNAAKRPTVAELFNFPPLAIRLKEKKLNQYYQNLKAMEEDLKSKEQILMEREKVLLAKEAQLNTREQQLAMREQQMMMLQGTGKENMDQNKMPTTIPQQNCQPLQQPQQQHQTQFTQLRRNNTLPVSFN